MVGITSPEALRGWRITLRVTPRSYDLVEGGDELLRLLLADERSDCSSTVLAEARSCETASLAWRILPSRSETNTGSEAFAMMMSAAGTPRGDPFAVSGQQARRRRLVLARIWTFLATAFLRQRGRCLEDAASLCGFCRGGKSTFLKGVGSGGTLSRRGASGGLGACAYR